MDRGRQAEIVRKLRHRDNVNDNAGAVILSSKHCMSRADFSGLAFYERRWIQAIAAGKAARKAALAGRSAARALDMWVVTTEVNEPVELLLPNGKAPPKKQQPANTVYHRARKRPATIRRFDTLRATDELTTAFEIALRHGFREGLVAMDWILKFYADRDTVEAEMEKLGRVRGIDTLRKVVRFAVDNSRSPFESYGRAILIERVAEHWIVNGMFAGYEVDLRRGMFVTEIDGDYKYDGVTFKPTDETLRKERRREKNLLKAGVKLLRPSPVDLLFREDEFVADVRRLLALAEMVEKAAS